jgi:hypothetical protein
MFPLLALTAAKVGSNLLNNAVSNSGNKKSGETSDADKKLAFAQLMAKVANNPQIKAAEFLNGQGIHNRTDAESTISQLSQKILQSSELSSITGGRPDSFDLKFLPDGNVSIKTADGREQIVQLEGSSKQSALDSFKIIENMKTAFPQNGTSQASHEAGGTLHIVPGGKSTLSA